MLRTTPPFRADHVGSLLRPAGLREARAKRERGEIGPENLKSVEDAAILAVIAKQKRVGLKGIPEGGPRIYLSHHGWFLRRSDQCLPQSSAGLRRCRMPVSAARRDQSLLSVRPRAAADREGPRR